LKPGSEFAMFSAQVGIILLLVGVVLHEASSGVVPQDPPLKLYAATTPTNVAQALNLLETALFYGMYPQATICLRYIGPRISKALTSPVFAKLRPFTVMHFLAQPWDVDEIEVLQAVNRWYNTTGLLQCSPTLVQAIANSVRLAALSPDELQGEAMHSGMYTRLHIDRVLRLKQAGLVSADDLRLPTQLIKRDEPVNTDLLDHRAGARFVSSPMNRSSDCVDSQDAVLETSPYPRCYSSQIVPANTTIQLGRAHMVNRLLISMPYHTYARCNFIITVSPDGDDWVNVMDLSPPNTRGYADELRTFEDILVRFVRVTSIKCFLDSTPVNEFRIHRLSVMHHVP